MTNSLFKKYINYIFEMEGNLFLPLSRMDVEFTKAERTLINKLWGEWEAQDVP